MTKSDKIEINPGTEPEILFLPVITRALESKKVKPILVDLTAIEITDRVNFDVTKLISSASELSRVAWIARCVCFDRLIKDFIRRYPNATIVSLGSGLDTTYERLNNGSIMWYDLDFPDVIKLRTLFMKEAMNRKFIACSFLDNTWYRHLNCTEHVLFIAGGVFYCYEEEAIRTLSGSLRGMVNFPRLKMMKSTGFVPESGVK